MCTVSPRSVISIHTTVYYVATKVVCGVNRIHWGVGILFFWGLIIVIHWGGVVIFFRDYMIPVSLEVLIFQ